MAGRYQKGWSKEHQMVFREYTAGESARSIAEKAKISINRVYNILSQKQFKEHHAKIVENSVESTRKALQEKLFEAAGQIIRIMRSGKPDDRIRFDAAKEILYQCGLKPVEVVENRTRLYTPEEIQSSLSTIKEIQTLEGTLSLEGHKFVVEHTTEQPAIEDTGVPSEETPVEKADAK